jgi:hypothetical protein
VQVLLADTCRLGSVPYAHVGMLDVTSLWICTC